MKATHFFYVLLVLLPAMAAMAQAPAQTPVVPDDALTTFLTTRDSYLVSPPGPNRPPAPRARASGPLGLGYTLFKKTTDGLPVRASATREFHKDEGVRFMIETNSAGYLYIFESENDEPPKMIFPDPRLKGGANQIKAHVPYEVPSREEAGDWWFFFDNTPATERFYLIVAREPLAGVKTGETLVAFCGRSPQSCPWRPSATAWQGLIAKADPAPRVSRAGDSGAAQTAAEREAVTRGVELRPQAPAPSVVMVTTSPKAGMLVAQVTLAHK